MLPLLDVPDMTAESRPLGSEHSQTWAGDFDPFADPDERRVLFAAFDSYRFVFYSYTLDLPLMWNSG